MAADESPKSRNKPKAQVKAVTIPTSPKSFGLRSRAITMREPNRRRKPAARARSLASAPRIVFPFRSCIAYPECRGFQSGRIALADYVKALIRQQCRSRYTAILAPTCGIPRLRAFKRFSLFPTPLAPHDGQDQRASVRLRVCYEAGPC